MGVPYKYKGKETCDKYIELAEEGKSDVVIAGTLGVTTMCIQKWDKQYPEFAEARRIGMEKCRMWYEEYCREKGAGTKYQKGDFQAARFLMITKLGMNDRPTQQIEVSPTEATLKIEIVKPDKNEDHA